MAVLYFTNNADSGDGSLRDVIEKAKSGDTIRPDEVAFAGVDLVTIKTSSQLNINKTLGFDAMGTRVRIDGQSLSRLVAVSNGAEVEFIDFDFVHGVNTSTCGGICATAANCRLVLQRCLVAGIKSSSALGAISTTNSSLSWSSVEAYDCVFTGLSGQAVTRSSLNWYYNCTIVGNVGNDTHINTPNSLKESASLRPSDMGFVVPPPDSISYASWTDDAWEAWDLRLRPESPFLHEATYDAETVDFLGNERKELGALGAIEGSWFIVKEGKTTTLTSDTTADRAEIYGGVVFDGVDRRLTVETSAIVGGAFSSKTGSNGYAAFPLGTELEAATFQGVVACNYGADATGVVADMYHVKWSSKAPTTPVLIEKQKDGNWIAIAQPSGGRYNTRLTQGETIRLFDGEKFLYATVKSSLDPWKQNAWSSQAWTLPNWELR